MPDDLKDLLKSDMDALAFFESLPMFARDGVMRSASEIQTREDLSGAANEAMHDAFKLEQYRPMFEDDTDSNIDLL